MKSFLRNIILGHVAQDIAAGKYGESFAALYATLKGRKTIIGGVVFLVGLALVQFAHPQAAQFAPLIVTLGAVLTSIGLMDKGTDKTPPLFDQGLAAAFALVCSIVTILGKAANVAVVLAQMSGKPWALHVSGMAQLIALACTTATGWLATYFVAPAPGSIDPSRFGGRSPIE